MSEAAPPSDHALKCVVVGDEEVGKTCLLHSYSSNTFERDYQPTVSASYKVTVQVQGEAYSMGLFDTAGKEEYDGVRPLSYPNADIYLVCFSVVSPSSFASVTEKWVPEILEYSPSTPFLIVGTKTDLRDDLANGDIPEGISEKPITTRQGRRLAKKLKVNYMECSALTQRGLKCVFDEAIYTALHPPKSRKNSWKCTVS
ncbi:cdc42 homolog [Haliotis cracherodii]|uniref:cdc42 homolog n=1 Tax=Haliotis cracherodii TaxID=6455 RepID=UPI0039EA00F8